MAGKMQKLLCSSRVSVRRLALLALLFALSVILSIVESAIPIPTGFPGVRLGLSNIVVMYTLFFLRRQDALTIALLKSCFVFLTRGTVAGLLSLTGGLASIGVMMFLIVLLRRDHPYLTVSIAGAVSHNLGQLSAATVILGVTMWYYLPVILISGAMAGYATSLLLRSTLPAIARLNLSRG